MFFTEQIWTGQTLWTILFFIFILIYPKYILYKMIAEMEEIAEMLEAHTKDAVDLILKISKEKGSPSIDPKGIVENAMDFFLIPPVELDPYGILTKVEHLIDKAEDRFEDIAKKIAPNSNEIWRANIISLVKGGIGLNNIAKVVRHYVEFIKKTNNLQLAMLIQMQLPMIKKIAKAQKKGVEAIADGKPIGDSIAPLIAANMIKEDKVKEIAKDVVYQETRINGRKVFVLKANGPGANLGKLGDGVKNICERQKISKIITIDAGVKLEGEKTGKVCEGIGAAIGDPGPEKAKIEEESTKNGIPLEAYVIKMSIEEAISPLAKDLGDSVPKALELVNDSISRSPERVAFWL